MNRWLREISQLRSADIDVAMSKFSQFRLIPSEHLHDAMTTLPFHELIFRSERSRYNTHFLWRPRSSHGQIWGAKSDRIRICELVFPVFRTFFIRQEGLWLIQRLDRGLCQEQGDRKGGRERASERYPCTEMRMLQQGPEGWNRYHHTDDLLQQHLSNSVADINKTKLTSRSYETNEHTQASLLMLCLL
jgi:hypothetical protein